MSQPESEIARHLEKVLNQHGYGFQYAVLRVAEEALKAGQSPWLLDAAEFPVQVGSSVVHVDFVLRHKSLPILLVGECKRADPSRARWCFVKAPYTSWNPDDKRVLLEEIRYRPADIASSHVKKHYDNAGSYNLSVELKTQGKPEGHVSRTAVNDAGTQVLRGMNGLINHLYGPMATFSEPGAMIMLPVIFTTAEVLMSDADLGSADIKSGDLPKDAIEVHSRPWIWYTYNQSAAIRHDVESGDSSSSLSDTLLNSFSRSMAIVPSSSIEDFLTSSLPDMLT